MKEPTTLVRQKVTADELRDMIYHEGNRRRLHISEIMIQPKAAGPEMANWTAIVLIEGMGGLAEPLAPVIERLQRQFNLIV